MTTSVTHYANAQDSYDRIVANFDDGISRLSVEYERRLREGKTKRLPSLERRIEEWIPNW